MGKKRGIIDKNVEKVFALPLFKMIKKGDLLVLTGVGIFIALLLLLDNVLGQSDGAGFATVELYNEEVMSFSLVTEGDSPEHFTVPLKNGEAILEVINGQVRVKPMPLDVCPLQICSSVGFVDKPGQAIVCLPNRMVITVSGEAEDPLDLDGITN